MPATLCVFFNLHVHINDVVMIYSHNTIENAKEKHVVYYYQARYVNVIICIDKCISHREGSHIRTRGLEAAPFATASVPSESDENPARGLNSLNVPDTFQPL